MRVWIDTVYIITDRPPYLFDADDREITVSRGPSGEAPKGYRKEDR